MMPRKKRRMIAISSIVITVIIILLTLILLYINTDMFKSSQTLFSKYLENGILKMNTAYQSIGNDEYENRLKGNKYTSNTQIKVNYTEGLGTSIENTQNNINQLKLTLDGQTDLANLYDYQDIKLFSNEEKAFEVEYVNKQNEVGIRFPELFKEYTTIENGEVKETLKLAGYTDEQLKNIPEQINLHMNLKELINFSEEEIETIKEKYLNLLVQGVGKERYSKQSNSVITVKEKKIATNAYIITLTKEELNNIYITMLENLKEDEIILTKLDKISEMTKFIGKENLRDDFKEHLKENRGNY